MNRIYKIAIILMAFAVTSLAAQSLGDRARELREKKGQPSTKRVITNEDLKKPVVIEAEAEGGESVAEAKPAATTEKAADGTAAAPAEVSPEDRAKLEDEYRGKAAEAKRDIAQLERELDVLQRENKLRAAVFYADAGNRLRNEEQYAAEDRRYQAEIEAKQNAVNAAKQKYEVLKDQARRAGLASRVTE